jgi:hypothetical protein
MKSNIHKANKKSLPLMDYVITGKNFSTMLEDVVDGVRKQSNVKRIIVNLSFDSDEATKELARKLQIEKKIDILGHAGGYSAQVKLSAVKYIANTYYVVLLDDDVALPSDWIEKLWPEMQKGVGSVYGIVVFDKYLRKWFERRAKRREEYKWARMQNTIIRRNLLLDIKDMYNIGGVDPDILFTRWIVKKGYKNILMPVIIDHAMDCHASDFKEGIRGGARLRRMGYYKSFKSVIKYGLTNILGGLRASLIMKTPYFIVAPIKKTFGMIIGYFAWDKYCLKYDFSCKK